MSPQAPPPQSSASSSLSMGGKNKSPMEQLVEEIGPTLNDLISKSIEPDIAAEKIQQLIKWRRAQMYLKGLHHVHPKVSASGVFTLEGFGPTGQGSEATAAYDYNFRLVADYCKKYTAVLGSRPFDKCKAVADDPKAEADVDAAMEANKGMDILRSWWDIPALRFRLAYQLFTSGTVFPYVRWVVNAKKYGSYSIPRIKQQSVQVSPDTYLCRVCGSEVPQPEAQSNGLTCTNCGQFLDPSTLMQGDMAEIPVHDGADQYPQGRAEIVWLNCSQATGAFFSPDMESQPYFCIDTDEPIGNMMGLYPHMREKIKNNPGSFGGSTTANQTALARSTAQSQTGVPRTYANKNLIQWRRLYVQSGKLQEIEDDDKRKKILEMFPNGLKVIKLGDDIAAITGEEMLDHVRSCAPDIGDYILVDGVAWGITGYQDIENDMAGLMVQTMERGMPTTIVEAGILDLDAINNKSHAPMEIIATMPGEGRSLDSSIKTLPSARFPTQIPEIIQLIQQKVQSWTGMLPTVFGQSDTTRKTADQVSTELNQALAQLSTAGEVGMSAGFRAIFDMGIKLLARHAPPGMSFKGKTLDKERLNAGRYHFESGLGIPKTQTERGDSLKEFISNANSPAAQAIIATLKLDGPSNSAMVRESLGIPEIEDSLDNHRKVVRAILESLIAAEPIPSPDGITLQPSIPYEDFVLDPQQTLLQVHDFLLEPDVRAQKDANPKGYANVVLFGQSVQQLLQPPQPPQDQQGAGPSPGDGSGSGAGGDAAGDGQKSRHNPSGGDSGAGGPAMPPQGQGPVNLQQAPQGPSQT